MESFLTPEILHKESAAFYSGRLQSAHSLLAAFPANTLRRHQASIFNPQSQGGLLNMIDGIEMSLDRSFVWEHRGVAHSTYHLDRLRVLQGQLLSAPVP